MNTVLQIEGRRGHKQRGVVLVVALIILLSLSLIGLITLQTGQMQERISGNMRQYSTAQQTADSTLREAEASVKLMADTSSFNDTNGLYTLGNAPDPFGSTTWTGTSSIVSGQTYASTVVTPRYYIEYMGIYGGSGSGLSDINVGNYGYTNALSTAGTGIYRIVSRGTGGGKSQIIYESYYGK